MAHVISAHPGRASEKGELHRGWLELTQQIYHPPNDPFLFLAPSGAKAALRFMVLCNLLITATTFVLPHSACPQATRTLAATQLQRTTLNVNHYQYTSSPSSVPSENVPTRM